MPISGSVKLQVALAQTKAFDLNVVDGAVNYLKNFTFSDGVGANQIDRLFHDSRTLGPSATEDLDFAGTLTDVYGATFTIVKLRGLIIYAKPTNINNLRVIRPAANGLLIFAAASDEMPIHPGGIFVWLAPTSGIAVAAGTGDLLTITNGAAGSNVDYDVFALGTSA